MSGSACVFSCLAFGIRPWPDDSMVCTSGRVRGQCTPVVWSPQHAVLVTHATRTCQDPQLQNQVLVQCLEHATLAPAMRFMQIPLTCGPHVCSWRQEECIVHCLNCILRLKNSILAILRLSIDAESNVDQSCKLDHPIIPSEL